MFQRFAPQRAFLKARLSTKGLFGLHFTVGVLILISAAFLFGIIAQNVVSGGALTTADVQIALWLHSNATSDLTQYLLILTHLHDPITISVVIMLIGFYLMWKKRWYEFLAVIVVVPGGMLLNLLVKQVFERGRPSFEDPLVILSTYSFPSGHVAATTVFYGMLVTMLISKNSTWIRTAGILLLAFTMIVLVAFSRLYLGAHYLSDVLAAFFEGVAWLAASLTAIHTYRIYHKK